MKHTIRIKTRKFGPIGLIVLLLYIAILYAASREPVSLQPVTQNVVYLYSNQSQDDLRKTFTDALLRAKRSITCVIYSLTDDEILQALKLQADRGVETKVICDAVATQNITHKLGNRVRLIPVRMKGLMHNKLISIDQMQAWLGSCNFTRDSLLCHANLVAGIESEAIAQAIEQKAQFLEQHKSSKLTPLSIQAANQRFELWFLPDDKKALQKITRLLHTAQKSVKVAMFTFTHPALIQTLIDLHRKGVHVQVVLDSDSSRKTSRVALQRFKNEKMDVRTSMRTGLLHEKIAIIDDSTLIGGSANWTKAAFTVNDEHIFVLYNLSEAQKEKLKRFWKTTLQESKKQ